MPEHQSTLRHHRWERQCEIAPELSCTVKRWKPDPHVGKTFNVYLKGNTVQLSSCLYVGMQTVFFFGALCVEARWSHFECHLDRLNTSWVDPTGITGDGQGKAQCVPFWPGVLLNQMQIWVWGPVEYQVRNWCHGGCTIEHCVLKSLPLSKSLALCAFLGVRKSVCFYPSSESSRHLDSNECVYVCTCTSFWALCLCLFVWQFLSYWKEN